MIPKDRSITFNTLKIPDDTNYWLCRADGGYFFEDYTKNGFIAVNDHGVELDTLLDLQIKPINNESISIMYEKYKSMFLESEYFKNILEQLKEDETVESQNANKIYRRKAFSAARRSFEFISSMKIGDFIVVPSSRSLCYAIGIISSDVFSSDIDRVNMIMKNKSNYKYKRKIIWLKQIERVNLPQSLSWGLTAHSTIYDITENAEDINKIIATSYVFKDTFYHQLLVTTEDDINSFQWFQFQRSIFEVAGEESESIFIKTNVQSPGFTELFANVDKIPIILVGIGALFGEVSVQWNGINVKFNGPLSFFMPGAKEKRDHEKKMRDLEYREKVAEVENLESQNKPDETSDKQKKTTLESSKLDNEQKKVNIEATVLANKQKELEIKKATDEANLAKDRLRAVEITKSQSEKQLETNNIHYNLEELNIKAPNFDSTQRKAINSLGIIDRSIEISHQKKEDSLD